MKQRLKIGRGEKGMALLETIPLLVVFIMLMSFGLGIFGLVHTAILHSIAARTYSFETFRQRTNLYYFREDGSGLQAGTALNYTKKGWRYHGINHESDNRDKFIATVRPIAIGNAVPTSLNSDETNNVTIYSMQPRNDRISVNPGWVMVGYGICLNAGCGN